MGAARPGSFPSLFSYGSALFTRFLLKNPIIGGAAVCACTRQEILCPLEVGSLPDFLSGNCLFPVDELIISAQDRAVIEAVV